jgi:hypothetical protein
VRIILSWEGWHSTGFWIGHGFMDHFNTQLIITLNYSVIGNFHTLQFTRAHNKSLQACSVFTSRCLVMAPSVAIHLFPFSSPLWMAAPFQLPTFLTADSHTFHTNLLVFSSLPDYQLSTFVTNWLLQTVPVKTSQHGLHENSSSVAVRLFPWENVWEAVTQQPLWYICLLRICCLAVGILLFVLRPLLRNECFRAIR